ncbi:hypothetical protein [Roseateles toxinivorans]|uniref:Uncharacterized protein n=1 Tax=Roseateles toxinivorans TaxID=270368 RepID=A0A4R6QG96_9BURK|nr:hypothetical protein [Roseateles toxinivorans]TDP62046.1 hypothetical protein DES47_10926 [Roseateles toxinivorans]
MFGTRHDRALRFLDIEQRGHRERHSYFLASVENVHGGARIFLAQN